MTRPTLVDLFCKAGGATRGYQRAGFYVVGVDIEPQEHYCGDEFLQMDALAWLRHRVAAGDASRRFAAIHASPPCQAKLAGLAAVNRALGRAYAHDDLVPATRALLRATGVPYVIEQPQQGARLLNPVVYCGSSFGLPIRRHRQFEVSVPVAAPRCDHGWQTERKYWTGWRPKGEHRLSVVVQVYGNGANRHEWGPALGIDWMTPEELTQAIPPAYTEHIGRHLLAALGAQVAA